MSDDLESLRAEVAALRAELAEVTQKPSAGLSRRRLLTGLGVIGAVSAAGAKPAAADDGDPLLIGEENAATTLTRLTTTHSNSVSDVSLGTELWGVFAQAKSIGVFGFVEEGSAGVWGEVSGPVGAGVNGYASDPGAIGVIGASKAGPAIAAQSELDGVTLLLTPAERSGPPTTVPEDVNAYGIGSLSVDEAGEVWLCTATGAPGTWTRLLREDTAAGRTIPITPTRVLDTRANGGRPSGAPAVPGQKKGPLKGSQPLTLDLAGAGPIPADATGVVGNIIAVTPNYSGYLRLAPSGTTVLPSAVNFPKNANVANAFTCALGPNGLTITGSGTTANTYHCVLDITAYIT